MAELRRAPVPAIMSWTPSGVTAEWIEDAEIRPCLFDGRLPQSDFAKPGRSYGRRDEAIADRSLQVDGS